MDFSFTDATTIRRFKAACEQFKVPYESLAPGIDGAKKFRIHALHLSPVDLIHFGSALGAIAHDNVNYCRRLVA